LEQRNHRPSEVERAVVDCGLLMCPAPALWRVRTSAGETNMCARHADRHLALGGHVSDILGPVERPVVTPSTSSF
jgi:hypothetical protein